MSDASSGSSCMTVVMKLLTWSRISCRVTVRWSNMSFDTIMSFCGFSLA